MKIKNSSLAEIILAVVLIVSITAVFATKALGGKVSRHHTTSTVTESGAKNTGAPEALGLYFEVDEGGESIIRSSEISSVSVETVGGDKSLAREDAAKLLALFSEAEVAEYLYPTHLEAQNSNPVYVVHITFSDGQEDVLYSTELGAQYFYRYTGTYGDSGDKGYVLAKNPSLVAFFDSLGL